MSADKRKEEPRATSVLIRIARWKEVYGCGRLVSGKLSPTYKRLIELGFVKLRRKKSWSAFGQHIRRTHAELTETGRKYLEIIQGSPAKGPQPPHKRTPRVEKKGLARDRRRPMDES